MKYVLALLFTFFLIPHGNAQPSPIRGTLLFNLTEREDLRELVTAKAFKNGKVRVLSPNVESELTYDTLHKAFSFTTNGFGKNEFAILYKNDTIYIDYPSVPLVKAVCVAAPIPLNGTDFSFSNRYTYDAMHSNQYANNSRVFYVCRGCSISGDYAMPEETKKHIRKELFTFTIKFKE